MTFDFLSTLQLSILMRVDVSQLKTPTDVYKAFDRILKDERLLEIVDSSGSCNIIKMLLISVNKVRLLRFR